jgi:hypothetical protein
MILYALIFNIYGSEILPKGEVLSEDSYVFSIEEAEELKARIIELEKKEKELVLYKDLASQYEKKDNLYSLSDEYKDRYMNNLVKINQNNQLIIDTYNRKERFSQLERYSYFALGAITAYSSVYIGSSLVK